MSVVRKITKKKITCWYDQRHASLGKDAWRPFQAYPVILEYLKAEPRKKLLDVGCGTGHLLKAASQKGLETYGIDISTKAVQIARKNAPLSQITPDKGENLDFPEHTFDYLVCLGALEHFLDMEKGIKEMYRVGKRDALFCIMVPNINYLFWKIKGFKGTEQQEINENLLSLDDWKMFFTNHRFEILNICQDQWFLEKVNVLSSFNPWKILKKSLYKLTWSLLPLRYTYQFIFVLKKRV